MNNMVGTLQDSEIIERVVGGDVNAFELLLKRYRLYVFKIISRHVPGDAVDETAQEAFIRAYQSLPSFSGKSSFSRWLQKIALRCCYDFWRASRRSREIPLSALTEEHEKWLEAALADRSDDDFQEASARKEAAEVLDYALAKLSPEDRIVLSLVHLEGLPVREVSELLGWNVVSVKVRSHRARRRLREIISDLLKSGW